MDMRHFSVEEVHEAVNIFWRSRGFIAVREKGQFLQFRCMDPHEHDALTQLELVAVRGGLLTLRRSQPDKLMSRWRFNDKALWVQFIM